MAEAYIVATARTAGGRRGGKLAGWHPVDLAAQVIDALVARSGIDPGGGRGRDPRLREPGRRAGGQRRAQRVLASKLPEACRAPRVDRQCGSSQQALHFAAQAVMSGTQDAVIAAGVESMTRVPMFTPNALPAKAGLGTYMSPRDAAALSGRRVQPVHRRRDAREEATASSQGRLDRYAFESHQRADRAPAAKARSRDEIVPIEVRLRRRHGQRRDAHRRRRHPLRRHARRHRRRQAARRGRPLHRGDHQPDLRRRRRRAGRQRARPEGAGREAAARASTT